MRGRATDLTGAFIAGPRARSGGRAGGRRMGACAIPAVTARAGGRQLARAERERFNETSGSSVDCGTSTRKFVRRLSTVKSLRFSGSLA